MWAGTRRGTTAPLRSLAIFSWDDGVVGKHPRLALQQFVFGALFVGAQEQPRIRRADPLILLGYELVTRDPATLWP